MRECKFQEWLLANEPEDKYIYKRAWWDQYTFWRDKILPMFTDQFYKEMCNVWWDKLFEELDNNLEIVGTHYSKSRKV